MKFRITAYSPATDSTENLAKPRSLGGAARRLMKDADFWLRMGWQDIMLEVQRMPGTPWRALYDDEVPRGRDELGRDERAELLGQSVRRKVAP